MSRNITTIPSGDSTLPSTAEAGFGSFVFFCRDVPSVPWCNLFYNQLSRTDFDLPDSRRAPVGIDPVCGIRRATGGGNVGNIANMIACILCAAFTFYLIQRANRRKAAVGRVELRATLGIYLLTCLVQFVTIGAILEQGSIPLVVLTAVHAGLIASLFWCLIGNAVIATQVVEDGTPASLLPFHGFSIVFFLATTYISLDTAFGFTKVFQSNPPEHLKNIALFILLELWPVFAILVFFGIMSYISISTLQETKPFLYYLGALLVFAGSQAVYLIASTPLCQMSNRLLDGSFIATILETASLGLVFAAWMAITEGSWDVQYFPA